MRLPGCKANHKPEDILAAVERIAPEKILSAAGRIRGRMQTPHKSGGRPPKPTACRKCGRMHPSARDARRCDHRPQ